MTSLTRRNLLLAPLVALAATSAQAKILPAHPRLFFRDEDWGPHNLTLDVVRQRGAAFADLLRVERKPNAEAAPDWAMLYVITGEEEAARTALVHMKRGLRLDRPWTTTEGDELEDIAVAYDWLAGTWKGFGGADRREVEEVLVSGAQEMMRRIQSGPSIYHTRMYAWANGILFAGLALHGERDEAAEFVDFGIRFWKERLIPARRHLGGAWFNAMSYGQKYMCRSVFSMLTAWRSATGEDLWKKSGTDEDDWARSMLYYLMYTLRPDHTFATYGDLFNTMAQSCQGTMRVVAQATSETRDPFGQGYLDEIMQQCGGRSTRWESGWYRIFFDPTIPAKPRSELPRTRLFGRDSIGMLLTRSGWGPNDTWALFKCGDYGDNHGHFDQGHFEIFHRGELVMDHHYGAKTTEYHNTILVSDPADPSDLGAQREFSRQNHGTFESYIADPVVNTGRILDFRDEDDLVYVLGDVTAAYDPKKVKSFTRQVAFVDGHHMVIFDVVKLADPRLQCRWQVHYSATPEIDGGRFHWENGGGRLTGRTLLPRKANLTPISCIPERHPDLNPRWQKVWPAGRLVVEDADGDSETKIFLHVLSAGDAGGSAPEVEFQESGETCEVSVAGKRLEFGKDGRGFRRLG